jgi:hypothetical protein
MKRESAIAERINEVIKLILAIPHILTITIKTIRFILKRYIE